MPFRLMPALPVTRPNLDCVISIVWNDRSVNYLRRTSVESKFPITQLHPHPESQPSPGRPRTSRSTRSAVIVPSFPESIAEAGIISFTESVTECFPVIPVPSAGTAPSPVIPSPTAAVITAAATIVTTTIPATHIEISFFAVCTVSYEQMQTRVTTLLSVI